MAKNFIYENLLGRQAGKLWAHQMINPWLVPDGPFLHS